MIHYRGIREIINKWNKLFKENKFNINGTI